MKKIIISIIALFCLGDSMLFAQVVSKEEMLEFESAMKEMMVDYVNEINKQTPMRLDEVTTFFKAMYSHPDLHYMYIVDIYKEDCGDSLLDEIKQSMKEVQLKNREFLLKEHSKGRCTPRELALFFKQLGFKWVYTYIDLNNEMLFRFTIDFNDYE